jgi:hypothetical protein
MKEALTSFIHVCLGVLKMHMSFDVRFFDLEMQVDNAGEGTTSLRNAMRIRKCRAKNI